MEGENQKYESGKLRLEEKSKIQSWKSLNPSTKNQGMNWKGDQKGTDTMKNQTNLKPQAKHESWQIEEKSYWNQDI